jgi:hypothetical protein
MLRGAPRESTILLMKRVFKVVSMKTGRTVSVHLTDREATECCAADHRVMISYIA